VEKPDRVLADYERVIARYHDTSPYSMRRIALAPCAPFNATEALFRETAAVARRHGVLMHTHLAETRDEDVYCMERFGMRPLEYVASLGWEGPDVWFAHCVMLNDEEVLRCASTGTGVAHCPSANARLGSGVAPIPAMLDAGVRVGLGVDGSSSNDSGNLLGEARLAFQLHRARWGVHSIDARAALRMLTRGGAAVLCNDKIGRLEVGACADIVAFDLDQYQYAGGASTDPLAALAFCGTKFHVDLSIINGRIVVEDGAICGRVEVQLVRQANAITAALLEKVKTKRRIDYSVVVDWPRKGG
jgi:cytosine/adenosine deaminase-related metal-dependent hydrolase